MINLIGKLIPKCRSKNYFGTLQLYTTSNTIKSPSRLRFSLLIDLNIKTHNRFLQFCVWCLLRVALKKNFT